MTTSLSDDERFGLSDRELAAADALRVPPETYARHKAARLRQSTENAEHLAALRERILQSARDWGYVADDADDAA